MLKLFYYNEKKSRVLFGGILYGKDEGGVKQTNEEIPSLSCIASVLLGLANVSVLVNEV